MTVIDLNRWHHAVHQITGDMALRFNRAAAADLERWARMLRVVAGEMEDMSKGLQPGHPARVFTRPDDLTSLVR